jgi:propionyl-CoA carboxylase alpha chain
VPGHPEPVADARDAARIAGELGYPVMLKASAGGGGKGMRIAASAKEVREGLASAMNEARAAFGDDRILIEKFIDRPRHIEIQVLADTHGNAIHLGERECSIQRRNQKVIEEAPSPLLDEATRAAMGASAVALAKAVGYASAGTVEFIVDPERNFYFLEMNTRLQVEHPVTELVTGLDLVELMIRIAAGEALPLAQDQVRREGWAVEARIYAEDPARGFLPSAGRLVRYRPPPAGTSDGVTVRVDSGVEEGGAIPVDYDPMIAKLCAHGPDRASAIAAMAEALDRFAIDGIADNLGFLSAVMAHPRWREGRLSTGFIAEEFGQGFAGALPDAEALTALIAIAVAMDRAAEARRPGGRAAGGRTPREVRLGADWHAVEVAVDAEGLRLTLAGAEHTVTTGWRPGLATFEGTLDGAPIAAQVRARPGGYRIGRRGATVEAAVYRPREAELVRGMPERARPDPSRHLLCPMPGLVVSIDVAAGQEVKAGERLCVVEAMKMENVLKAERDVTVAAVKVAPGDSLAVDAVIMEFA